MMIEISIKQSVNHDVGVNLDDVDDDDNHGNDDDWSPDKSKMMPFRRGFIFSIVRWGQCRQCNSSRPPNVLYFVKSNLGHEGNFSLFYDG